MATKADSKAHPTQSTQNNDHEPTLIIRSPDKIQKLDTAPGNVQPRNSTRPGRGAPMAMSDSGGVGRFFGVCVPKQEPGNEGPDGFRDRCNQRAFLATFLVAVVLVAFFFAGGADLAADLAVPFAALPADF